LRLILFAAAAVDLVASRRPFVPRLLLMSATLGFSLLLLRPLAILVVADFTLLLLRPLAVLVIADLAVPLLGSLPT